VDVQLDAGQVGAQHPDQRRQQVIGGRAGEPDRDPAQHPVGHLSGLGDRVVHLCASSATATKYWIRRSSIAAG
jgi:hypothetical protein